MHSKHIRYVSLFVLAALLAVGAFAQTTETGAITGRVAQGDTPLPGVTVEVRSPNLQGVRSAVTDSNGAFRFTLLPPGQYTLTANLAGFNPVTERGITVGLNRTVTMEVALSPQASEQITVTAAAPVVDITSAATGANVTAETMQALPIARNFTAAAQVAPGTSRDATGTTFYGSTGAENQYIIDGLNTTEVAYGREGKRLNFDFIQEVEVMTGGLPAEYGRMTGGAINAITKSGSNEFHGDVFGYTTGGGLNADDTTDSDRPATTTTITEVDKQFDYGVNFGGYILRDRLWFFGAYDRVSDTINSVRVNTALVTPDGYTVPVGGVLTTDIDRDLYAAKLSLALTSSHLINVSVLGDPSESSGAQFSISGPPSTFMGTNEFGGNDVVARYSGVFGSNWNVNATAGRHEEKNILSGEGASIPRTIRLDVVPNQNLGGFGFFQNQEFKRDVIKADISAFFGSHQFKFGADREDLLAENNRFFSGGDRVRQRCSVTLLPADAQGIRRCPAGAALFYVHEVAVDDTAPGFDRTNPATAVVVNPLIAAPETENTSFYVQDSWKALSNLTLNLGVRWEQQQIKGRLGEVAIDLDDMIAPRVGVIWDPANNGRSKLYVNYGRFFESIPMDINLRTFGGEVSLQVANFNPTPGALTPDPAAPAIASGGRRFTFLGQHVTPVDPDLDGQYIDEYLLGYDYEIAPNLAVGVKGTYRDLGQVIEDFLQDPATGEYLIGNPAVGLGKQSGFLSGEFVDIPKAKREYTGVELHATKRFSNNYQFFASYLWSRLEGNYDGTFQASTGQLDPNINSAYDYADFAVNNEGLLSNDRTHQLKFHGSYTFSDGFAKGLDLGIATQYSSGTPLTAFGYEHAGYRNYEYYLTERGSLGRGPANYEADVHVGYPIELGVGRLNLLVDVFNIMNRQAATAVDTRYNLSSDPVCSGIPANICNGFGGIANIPGTFSPAGTLSNARATATNPDFLTAGTAFTNPRSIRVGARFSW